MDSMEKHVYDRSLQTSGSACLYYVVDMFQNQSATILNKYADYLKRLLLTILQAMTTHIDHSPVITSMRKDMRKKKNDEYEFIALFKMIRNGLLTISRMQMHLPNHIVSKLERNEK
jgi:hypothetical protein